MQFEEGKHRIEGSNLQERKRIHKEIYIQDISNRAKT
jgi:hypothetical protein